MLVVTSDTLPDFVEVEAILGQTTSYYIIELRKGFLQSIFDRDRNDLDDAHKAFEQQASMYRSNDGRKANLVYGVRISTCVSQGENGPVMILTMTGTVAIFRNTTEE